MIERGARRDAELLADLADGRRHAVARRERADEREHFALPPRELFHAPSSLDHHHTQRVLRMSSKKKSGPYVGSHGSHTGHRMNPRSVAAASVAKSTRSPAGMRRAQSHAARWKIFEPL